MTVPIVITDLSPVADLNSPQGTDPIGTSPDNYFRAHAGFIAQVYAAQSATEEYTLSYAPVRGALLSYAIQFRGATDTSESLGTIGLVINESTNSSASFRLASTQYDWSSDRNGATATGKLWFIGPYTSNILRIHIGQLGLTAPYTDETSGPVQAATPGMTRLTWDNTLNIRALLISEGPTENYAGTAGTGSARTLTISGLVVT